MKQENKKPFIITFSLVGLAALAVMFCRWRIDQSALPLIQRAAALFSVALFAAAGLRIVPQWAAFWSAEPMLQKPEQAQLKSWKLFLTLLGWDTAA